MTFKFSKAKWNQDGDGVWLALLVNDRSAALRFLENMKDKEYTAELKEYKEKRSLEANAYLWVLLGKLAAKLRSSPEEVYREAIKGIGDNYIIVPVRTDLIEQWQKVWQSKGAGWIAEEFLPCKTDGYTYVRNFYGSST